VPARLFPGGDGMLENHTPRHSQKRLLFASNYVPRTVSDRKVAAGTCRTRLDHRRREAPCLLASASLWNRGPLSFICQGRATCTGSFYIRTDAKKSRRASTRGVFAFSNPNDFTRWWSAYRCGQ
jgi:hypothetical protein